MATVTLRGNPINTNGDLPKAGSTAPNFRLTGTDMQDVDLGKYKGKRKVLSIVPSLDTGVCAEQTRKFNQKIGAMPNTVVLTVSADLPFAMKRFCSAEGIENVVPLSMIRGKNFAKDYGVLMTDGPMEGIAARAVVVLDENDKVVYTELVPEIAQEPNYDKVIAALS